MARARASRAYVGARVPEGILGPVRLAPHAGTQPLGGLFDHLPVLLAHKAVPTATDDPQLAVREQCAARCEYESGTAVSASPWKSSTSSGNAGMCSKKS